MSVECVKGIRARRRKMIGESLKRDAGDGGGNGGSGGGGEE